jgi:hypothetical protein
MIFMYTLHIRACTKQLSMCVCMYSCTHVYHMIHVISKAHTATHKSVGIQRVDVVNPVCNDQLVAGKPA